MPSMFQWNLVNGVTAAAETDVSQIDVGCAQNRVKAP
jgi:hypothetical protein